MPLEKIPTHLSEYTSEDHCYELKRPNIGLWSQLHIGGQETNGVSEKFTDLCH